MDKYLVIKDVKLLVGDKTFGKDKILTAEMVGQGKINRYLARGYIRAIGADSESAEEKPAVANPSGDNLPFYLTAEDYLTPEQVDS